MTKPLRLTKATLYIHNDRVVRTVDLSEDKTSAIVRHHGENPYTVNTAELSRADKEQVNAYLGR